MESRRWAAGGRRPDFVLGTARPADLSDLTAPRAARLPLRSLPLLPLPALLPRTGPCSGKESPTPPRHTPALGSSRPQVPEVISMTQIV